MQFELSTEYLRYVANAYLVPFGIRILIAILVFVIGRMIARYIVRVVDKLLDGRVDDSLRKFLCSVLRGMLLAVVIIAALERLGVQTTAAIAILGAAGLAIGLALQGSLGNFASGVLLILFRPYKIGDVVNLAGNIGTVETIEVFNTIIVTADNRVIILPNGQVTSSVIENFSVKPTRRIDLVIGIGYGDDLKKAKEILNEIVASDPRVLKEPAPNISVSELGESSVNFIVRPWVLSADYWPTRWALTEQIKLTLDENNISIPFPQRDVHLHNVQ